MSQFINSIKEVKNNWKKYDSWEQEEANDAAKRKYLSDNLDLPADKVALTKEKTKIILRASDLLDKRSENNCENMELKTSIISVFALIPFLYLSPMLNKLNISKKLKGNLTLASYGAIFLVGGGITLWGNNEQKKASRVGRFQAKQHELKDIKNFVIYTPEQIEAAQKIAKNIPDKKDKRSISKFIADIKQMSKDKKDYKNWLNNNESEQNFKNIMQKKYSPEQIQQGKEDKEIITNIVKDINIKAEEYSENMENAYDTMGTLSLLGSIPLAFAIKKLIKKLVKNPSKNVLNISMASPFIVTLMLIINGTQQQKKAAQIGRFKKSKEILNNPEVLMDYTDEQMSKAKNIKASKQKKGFFKDIFANFVFLINYHKDKKEFIKHEETEQKQQEKLLEALKQSKISDEQLKDAKFLQEKTFLTFDKIDEMSQRFSEDTEAATELTKQLSSTMFPILGIICSALLVKGFKKGSIPLRAPLNGLFNLALKKESPLRIVINQLNAAIKQDKTLRKNFSKIFVDKQVRQQFFEHPQIKKVIQDNIKTFTEYTAKLKIFAKTNSEDEILAIGREIFKENFRQDPFSKWLRNISFDIMKLWASAKSKLPNKIKNENISSFEKMKKYFKEYNTLSKTLLFGGFAPLIIVGMGVPFAFNSWLNNVQKKAGKIGIMKATEEIDHPELFVNE